MREVNVQSDEVMLKFGWYAAQSAGQEHEVVHNMADEIVRLREALAAATRVRVLDEWRVLTKDGEDPKRTWWIRHEWAVEDAAAANKEFPADAPHRVVRVALVDADSHQSVPSDHATRVTEEMVKRAIRVGRDYGYFDWDESGEERVAGMRAVLTAALEGPRD